MRTITEVHKAIIGQLESALGKALPIFPKAFIRVLSKMLAGVFVLLDKYVGFLLFQLFITTATWEEIDVDGTPIRPLVAWGERFGVSAPVEPIEAELTTTMTVATGGETVAKGAQFLHRPSGLVYLCTASTLLATPTTAIPIKCVTEGAGVDGNQDNGATIDIVLKPLGAERQTVVASTTVVGVDGETEDEYRQRVLNRTKQVPEGGAPGHFKKWALEPVTEIVKAYPYLGTLPASVEVYIDTEDGTPPTAPQITNVQAYLELKAAAGDQVFTDKVSRKAFVVDVSNLTASSPSNQSDAEDAVEDVIENYFADREPFTMKVSVLPRKNVLTYGEVFGLVAKMAATVNATFSSVQITLVGSPVSSYDLGKGERVTVTVNFI